MSWLLFSQGTIFSIDTDGNNFTLLHQFFGGNNSAARPFDSLISSSGKLYGMTPEGGDANEGTIFSISPDGNDFTILHEFLGGSEDGSGPYGSLTPVDGKLYGTTFYGGDNDYGTIFVIPEPATLGLLVTGSLLIMGHRRK